MNAKFAFLLGVLSFSTIGFADPEKEADSAAQSAADVMRKFAEADLAFLPAGSLKGSFSGGDLSGLMQYPTDTLSIVKLSGTQVRAALERSVSLLPMGSGSFLQLSGLTVTYSKSAASGKRILSVMVSEDKLSEANTYAVAMPTTLARGGLGYFKIWDRNAEVQTLSTATLESILKGKSALNTEPRWTAQ